MVSALVSRCNDLTIKNAVAFVYEVNDNQVVEIAKSIPPSPRGEY